MAFSMECSTECVRWNVRCNACSVMYSVMAYAVIAYIVMADIVMVYIVMAHIAWPI